MKKENTYRVIFWATLLFISFLINSNVYATHAQSADITYQCIGTNQYQISVSFYRDCAGVAAPNSITINTASASCVQNFNTTLNPIPGTGQDVTPVCQNVNTECNGGSVPGVEEYIYRGIVNLPNQCNDWKFSFTLCCRNNAINTILNPGNENIYVEALLNNLDVVCNNSPTFSNKPVSFPCVGQTSCFNHGAIEPDGDSLFYSLIAPATGPATAVTYIPGYSAQQPLISNPATTFNTATGDICMTPTLREVTVLAVKVEEWRNGILIGSVIRDIQLRTVICNNTLPTLSGINGSNAYTTTGCAGVPINFTIPSFDPDPGQTITLTWNNAIPGATFVSNGAQIPTATFNWTPTVNDVSLVPHCFTVTARDDNCTYNGIQIYSFCITVNGFTVTTTSTPANCGASNGSASASIQGGNGPYAYQWLPNGGNYANANGLQPGQYTVNVTDANGCISASTITVGQGPLPGNINIASTNVSCFGGNNGSATANVNGGQPPYVYFWSNNGFTQTISNLTAGTYWVKVTANGGCITYDTIVITQPSSPLTAITTQSNATCYGANDGFSSVIPAGGTGPYTATWNSIPQQNGLTATNLPGGTYVVTVTDNNGCITTQNVTIGQPQPITINLTNQQNVSCFGGNTGLLSIAVTGGTGPYSYNWNNNQFPNNSAINGLTAGGYLVIITDANGCTATNQFTISEPTELIASIASFTDITCNGLNDGTIQTTTIGGTPPYNYQWIPVLTTAPNVTNLSFGYYVMMVTDDNGCFDTTGVFINEPAPIVTIALGSDTLCPGQSANLSAIAVGGTGNYTYHWSNLFTGATQTVSPTSTTTFTVFATDANGCIGTMDSVNVLVNDINMINLSVVPDTTLCEGSPYLISANVSGGLGSYNYSWNNGLGQGPGPFVVAPLTTKNYIVTVTDDCGNSINQSVIVTVNPFPTVNIPSQIETGCGKVELNLSNNNSNPTGSTYFWDLGDGSTSTLENPVKTYTQTGVYNVVLTVTSPFGCVNSGQSTMNVIVHPQSIAQFDFDPRETSIINAQITFDNFSVNADYNNWSFGDGATSNQTNPVHNYEKDGTYIIMLITNTTFGCKDTAIEELIIDPEFNFYIPNAFTPNNDGRNDIFTAVGEEIEVFEMQIFNRWGELIYETSSLEKGWDGTANNGSEISMQGVYVYNIRLQDWQGVHHKFIGKVSLLK